MLLNANVRRMTQPAEEVKDCESFGENAGFKAGIKERGRESFLDAEEASPVDVNLRTTIKRQLMMMTNPAHPGKLVERI